MYDIAAYGAMIADVGRTSAYGDALALMVLPGATVLDLGTGPGIMALLACRAGARKVYAVEADDVIQIAREAAAASGFADRIQFLQARSLDLELPERVDGIVADVRGVLPQFGGGIVSLIDARERFLKSDGWMIPSRDSLFVAVVECPERHAGLVDPWNPDCGFNFSSARARSVNCLSKASFQSDEVIVEPVRWAALDYLELRNAGVNGEVSWTVPRSTTAHGLGVWFDSETAPGCGFSNSPIGNEQHVYGQSFFPWPCGTALHEGDTVRVRIRAALVLSEYVWSWTTRVIDGAFGSTRVTYDQSTLRATSISGERLRKHAHAFVPSLNEDAKVDQRILDLMGASITIGNIADQILVEFPTRFKDWMTALTRVGELSDRYSV